MAFKITDVTAEMFPTREAVVAALEPYQLSPANIEQQIHQFVCSSQREPGKGYQQYLAPELERYLRDTFTKQGRLKTKSNKYCSELNENADLVLGSDDVELRIYFEIEFRPNVEKDLVKFQIGCNSNRLGAAVLILANNRKEINPDYSTMPEFHKFVRVIRLLNPSYPLLLLGISGEDA